MKSTDVFPSKYLKAEDVDGEPIVTIASVELESMKDKSGADIQKPVIYFSETDKGLVANKTNWSLIAKQYGDESDDWIGKQITLTVMDVDSFGDIVSAIRVKPQRKVASKPALSTPASTQPDQKSTEQKAQLSKDAKTMFWSKAYELGIDREVAQTFVDRNGGNFVAAYDELMS